MSSVSFIRGDGEPLGEVRLEHAPSGGACAYVVHLRDHQCDVEIDATTDHAGQIHLGGRVVPFRVCRRDGGVDVWIDGRVYSLLVQQRVARRAGATAAAGVAGDLVAPMPGTILKVNVAPGDAFAAHDPLVIMESMKMEMSVSSPHAGRVAEVLCAAGDLVELGAMLVKLEEA